MNQKMKERKGQKRLGSYEEVHIVKINVRVKEKIHTKEDDYYKDNYPLPHNYNLQWMQ
jgi:hypothetical protein